jgi:hypothetical protein
MRSRLVLVLVCAVVLLLGAAPTAQAAHRAHAGGRPPGVETVDPDEGRAGAPVSVDVSGSFDVMDGRPTFRLSLPGQPEIVGETVVVNFFIGDRADTATVRFDLPQAAAPGVYTLTAYQGRVALRETVEYTVLPPETGISGLEPASVDALGRAFDLRVSGHGFSTASRGGSVVYWDQTALATTRNSAVLLTARVPAALIASPGGAVIRVQNGSGATATSSGLFSYHVLVPVPSISSLTPDTVAPGGPAFELRVLGARFLLGAVVVWGGVDLATRRVSSVVLKATVPSALTPYVGDATVRVRNGGAVATAPQSVGVTFSVAYPVPRITALAPNLVRAGGPAFDLGVTGTLFLTGAAGSVVRWNDTDLATTRDSGHHLTATVPAALTASAGAAHITVRNGPAGLGRLSSALTFTVGANPAITILQPATAVAGSGDVTLTVKGTHFVNSVPLPLPGRIGSRVEWNGAALSTTYKSPTLLQATIPKAKLAAAGVAQVTVRNVAEGTVSNARAFTITPPRP